MFSGIVTGIGRVLSLDLRKGGGRLTIAAPARYGLFRRGESVCVSGVCLTAISSSRRLSCDLSEETLRRSTLSGLAAGDSVNLERALAWGDRLSGHFVLGHVDGVSRLLSIAKAGGSKTFRFSIPAGLSRFVVEKGSVALDGVSLTVARRGGRAFDVALIPETLRRTTLGSREPGDRANFEADVFARYGARGWRRVVRGRGSPSP